ncbi:glycosyltransferase family 2 protein [Paramicrobacterium agarici]|uniref:Glycosyl transferase family 2 n=1 Tax=Paramicrobacterium agarici TaxID=630514 RepID=A0A2A9DV53_9MICO|nr:glycosyltransferase [Microbacterium agarici]PFG30454.1 glycosyl transferase family 2 [Microbacterium agarici]
MTAAVPPVTIAMPVYNGADYIARSLAALQSQTFADFELLIRDNASTDDTEGIVQEFASSDSRIRYTRNEQNIGGARNSNALLADASAPLIMWAYHDDEPHPLLIKDSVDRLSDAGQSAVVAYPRVNLIDENSAVVGQHEDGDLDLGQPSAHERIRVLFQRKVAQIQFGLMRTHVVRESGGISVSTGGEFIMPTSMALRGRCLLSSPDAKRLSIRQHVDRSGGHRNSEAEWIDPSRPNVPFPYSRSITLMMKAVARAPLSMAERRRCFNAVLRYWAAPQLRSVAGDVARLPWDAGWITRR